MFLLQLAQRGMAPSAAWECGAEEQTVDHVILQFAILSTSLWFQKTCFKKRLKFIVIIQDMQPTKTTLYKFQQTLAKKCLQGATLWANVEQQFKDKSHNTFSNQYLSFLLLQHIHLVKFLIKILPHRLSYHLRIRLACISDCSYGLQCGIWHFVVGNWSISMVLISGLFDCFT